MSRHLGFAYEGLAESLLRGVDPRLSAGLKADFARRMPHEPIVRIPPERQIVLVGHRAAGKSRILPAVARLVSRKPLDLDRELERVARRPLKEWLPVDPTGFRAAEKEVFLGLPPGVLVSVGGGFLSHHPEALAGHYPVMVPVSFETYRERLLADTSRPRLRSELSPEEEIRQVYESREHLHVAVPTHTLVDLLLAYRPW